MAGRVRKRTEAPHRTGSWNVLKSGFHAFSGLMWVTPRTPSLRLGIVVVIALAAAGVLLRFTSAEIALLVLLGTLLLAVETINTAIEMLCDLVQPLRDPKIGRIKEWPPAPQRSPKSVARSWWVYCSGRISWRLFTDKR